MKKRCANKEACPCECGNRLGRCRFNRKMQQFRQRASRSWFRAHQIQPRATTSASYALLSASLKMPTI